MPRTASRSDYDVYVYDEASNQFYRSGTDDAIRSGGSTYVELPKDVTGGADVYNPTFHDGINAITAAPNVNTNSIYTISGQRVARPTQKGLYIINGRKVRTL